MESSNSDFFAITETSCNESIHDNEIIPPGYKIIRSDRMDGRKQGGAFFVATNRFELLEIPTPTDVDIDSRSFEFVSVCVYSKLNSKFLFVCTVVYISPRSSENEYMILFRLIEQLCYK